MEEKKIKVTDSFKVSDRKGSSPVKGLVVLKKPNGEIVFKKNNLVVREGRKILKDLFAKAINVGSGTDAAIKYTPSIVIGTGTSITTDETKLGNFENQIEINFSSDNAITLSDENENDLYILFTISITGNGLNSINMSELGIKLSYTPAEGGDATSILFSRIVFDPLPFTASYTYTLEYYLYF